MVCLGRADALQTPPQLLKGFKSPGVTTPYMSQAGLLKY